MEEVVEDVGSSQEESGVYLVQDKCIQDDDVTTTAGLCNESSAVKMMAENEQSMYDTGEAEFEESAAAESSAVMNPTGEPQSSIAISEIEDVEGKLSEGEVSPPTDDNLGRRIRKPSRYHDSMFDIPTNLLNINRTINPEEFRAFHSKGVKQKEKIKKVINTPISKTEKQESIPEIIETPDESPAEPSPSYSDCEDDVLESTNIFKFKMRKFHLIPNPMGGPTSYKCDVCLMTFPRSFSLRRHYTRRHINPKYVPVKKDGPPTNEIADKVQQPPANIYGTEKEKFLYACKMCSKDLMYFKHKGQLHMHCLEQHNAEPRREVHVFKCEICKRSYSTRHELERHKRAHSGERPYSCGYCHKTFPTSTNARRHERTHTGDRPHICKVCNKGFIQRTDMAKHLKSMHKMKVTKTKAQKSGFSLNMNNVGHTNQNNPIGFGMEDNNEFQENIDFAAYLNLDQHISGTLMGEEASRPSLPGKDPSIKDISRHAPNHLKNLPPSQIVGADGKLEKVHRCPDCSKMFTNNINLRRHYKLKHERNQIYQGAEPVSMVVEKFKIIDDTIAKEGEKIHEGTDASAIPVETVTHKVSHQDESEHHSQSFDLKGFQDISQSTEAQGNNDDKVGKHSKLSSIVQRLAKKISAKQSTRLDGKVTSTSVEEKQPITQLEELGNYIFGQSTIKADTISPKRNKRKPTNVHHVPIKESPKEITYDTLKHKTMLSDKYKQQHKQRHHQIMPQYEELPTSVGGIYKNIFESGASSRHVADQMNMHRYNEYLKDSMHPANSHAFESGLHRHEQNKMDRRMKEVTDLSKMAAPSHSQEMMSSEHCYPESSMPHRKDASRIETFLSQCYSSKKCDVPQNAVLDKNLPIRDSNAMTKKLKYNMKHLSNARVNEHLPPSAYFSQRDRVFSPGQQKEQFLDLSKSERNPSNDADSEAPLDLRIQSKKETQDYVVRDDGVLDFSRKTRNTIGQSKSKSDSPSIPPQEHPRVKIEPFRNMSVFPDRRYNESYSRQYTEDIPTWLQSSYQKFASPGTSEQRMDQMVDSRRDLLHGRPSSSKTHKPFKFHCMDHKAPYRESPSPMDAKPRMSHASLSYRQHPYLPMHPPGRSGLTMGRRRYTPPSMYSAHKEDSRSYPSNRMMASHMQKHYPPSTQYHASNMPMPRYPHQSREMLPSYPGQLSRKNWQRDHRRESNMSHTDHPTPLTNNLRHILPKGDWKNDMLLKSSWKEEPRPIPSSIQRLALKRSQRASPFDNWDIFDDKDMMNRCIEKAQQSLKKEPTNNSIKQSKSEIFSRDPIAFKSNPSMPPYLKKLEEQKLISRRLPSSKLFVTTSSSLQTRSQPFTQPSNVTRMNPTISHVNEESGAELYGMLNLTSTMKSPQPYDHENERGHNARNKDSPGQVDEVSQEELGDREKLTMTPGLESSHDTIEPKTLKTDDENTNPAMSHNVENEAHAASTDFSSIEHDKCNVPEDLSSDNMNEIRSMKSAFVDNRLSSGKVVNRRHTHAHPGDDSFSLEEVAATFSDHKKGLKRSCSDDSNQCDSLSDDGDGSSRKVIKKLKLRVIKSPGSEHKKYWTLVDQDRPLAMNMIPADSSLPTTSEQQEPQPFDSEKLDSNMDEITEDMKDAEISGASEQQDLLTQKTEPDLVPESTAQDLSLPDKDETAHDEATETVEEVCSTNNTSLEHLTNTTVTTESPAETDLVAIETTKVEEDEKHHEIESTNHDEEMLQCSNDTSDIGTNLATTQSPCTDKTQNDTAIIDTPSPDTDTQNKEDSSEIEDIVAEASEYTSNVLSTQLDAANESTPETCKVPEAKQKNAELSENNIVIPSRMTRSTSLSAFPVRSEKKPSGGNTNIKKTDSVSAELATSNRLRRSVRIRKTSADKDAVVSKKKK